MRRCPRLNSARLPLSPKLRARLARWCARFQKSFETEIDLDAFAAEGRAIARAVKAELPAWSIVYFDEAAAARAKYQGIARHLRDRDHNDRAAARRASIGRAPPATRPTPI